MSDKGMPWFKFDSDTPRNRKVRVLRSMLGEAGEAALYRLWCYCADANPSGHFKGAFAVHEAESQAEWSGDRGLFVSTRLPLGLLDGTADCFDVHQWSERQSALRSEERRVGKECRS